MPPLKIALGNKNYSSWSLRPWLVLKHIGVPFEETVIPLDQPTTHQEIARYSPAGRVPVLIDGDLAIWDSLAICEYLNDQFPQAKLWPSDKAARARARSISAEMHSGFMALRNHCPMKFKEVFPPKELPPDVRADIDRIQNSWADCRKKYGAGGPFLFGSFTIADAMYAPVASRFRTFSVPVPDRTAAAYWESILNLPAMQEWMVGAKKETHKMSRYDAPAAASKA